MKCREFLFAKVEYLSVYHDRVLNSATFTLCPLLYFYPPFHSPPSPFPSLPSFPLYLLYLVSHWLNFWAAIFLFLNTENFWQQTWIMTSRTFHLDLGHTSEYGLWSFFNFYLFLKLSSLPNTSSLLIHVVRTIVDFMYLFYTLRKNTVIIAAKHRNIYKKKAGESQLKWGGGYLGNVGSICMVGTRDIREYVDTTVSHILWGKIHSISAGN